MIKGYELIEKMYSDYDEYEVQEEKLYSTGNDELDDLLEKAFCEGYEYAQREFGNKANKKNNKEDEEESEDTKLSNKLTKIGKKVAIAGGITAGLGAGIGGGLLALGGKRGAKANSDISNLKDDIESHEFFMKDHFGDRNRSGFFGNMQRDAEKRHGKLKSEAEDKIKEILRKDGKHAKANKAGKIILPIAAGIGTGIAAVGGAAYGIGKAREIAKRRRLDILKKDREEMRREIEEEKKNNKKEQKK